jgi:SAM-dependent methyltransferase
VRWLAKAAAQRAFGLLPNQGEGLNYALQRHVIRSLPASEGTFRKKFSRAVQHLRLYEEHASGPPAAEATFYEFGAGWDLTIPLAFTALGVPRQILVDIRPVVRPALVNDSLSLYARLWTELQAEAERNLTPLGAPTIASTPELEPRFGIRYLAPCDARATGLPDASVDFISSTDVCEHIPEPDLAAILRECGRLLPPGGLLSFRIDLADHYSYFDKSLSRYHFLRYDDRRWGWANSPLQYQNRLRVTDYRRLVDGAGFEVVSWSPSLPKNAVAELNGLPLAPHFRDGYTPEELGVTVLSFVARRQ